MDARISSRRTRKGQQLLISTGAMLCIAFKGYHHAVLNFIYCAFMLLHLQFPGISGTLVPHRNP